FNGRQVSEIGAEAARNARTAPDAMESFRRRLTTFLPNALIAEEEMEPALDAHGNRIVLEAVYAGFDQGRGDVIFESFRREGGGALVTDRQTFDSPVAGRYDFLFAGKRRAVERYMAGRSVAIHGDTDAIGFITRAIGIEIADTPETTAGPIDILQMTANGRRWLQCKLGCQGF
ncbi:MAG: hypothetical protein WA324_04050, partial [Bryobacteraceae bacterium]